MQWPQFSRIFPEDGADWLAYWRERGGPRPECNFTQDEDDTIAVEIGPPNRRWRHNFCSVAWVEETQEKGK